MIKCVLAFLLFSGLAMASGIDCSNPKNVNDCARNSYSQSEMKYNDFINRSVKVFKKKTSTDYLASFIRIEKHWKSLAISQCSHLKEFYQGGSLSSSSYISCLDVMYDSRIKELKTIYDDILGER
jgi:uncharacterized protein YecT (DUF1311 family)